MPYRQKGIRIPKEFSDQINEQQGFKLFKLYKASGSLLLLFWPMKWINAQALDPPKHA